MRVELDHFFILTAVDAPEAEQLLRFGLTEGAPNRHPGQGTACRRFFFRNAFLELLWATDPAEAQSDSVRRTGLWERWSRRGRDASPFGICVRPTAQGASEAPFPTWEYRPPYLPDELVIRMGVNSHVPTEPLIFYSDFGRRPDSAEPDRRQPLEHPAGVQAITGLHLRAPWAETLSAELGILQESCPGLRFERDGEYLAEVSFDNERSQQTADLRPHLPLILRW
jgi:hypothetical protein